MSIVLSAAKLLTPLHEIDRPQVTIEDGVIVNIESGGESVSSKTGRHFDFPGAVLAPAYFDVHTHGAVGHDVMEGTEEAFDAIGKFLATHGVGAYLPSTVTASVDQTLHALEGMARQIERLNRSGNVRGARPVGIHLEGPFLSHERRGMHPPKYLLNPSTELLHRFWDAAGGHIVLITIAPELPGAVEFIQQAVRLGIRVSIGHSDALAEQAMAAIQAGARSATHTFNAMRPLDHRDPGILGVVLDDRDLFSELICDGVHVDPRVVRLFHRSKSADRAILITDAMSGTGMPDGVYTLGGLEVTVADGKCMRDGALAGSVLTLDRAVRNFVEFTGAPRALAVRCASTNPAQLAGFAADYGELAPGRPANIAVLSPKGEIMATILNGELLPG